MVRRRIQDLGGRDQSASGSQHDREDINSGEYENASGIRDESTDDKLRPNEVDLHQNSPEEDGLRV